MMSTPKRDKLQKNRISSKVLPFELNISSIVDDDVGDDNEWDEHVLCPSTPIRMMVCARLKYKQQQKYIVFLCDEVLNSGYLYQFGEKRMGTRDVLNKCVFHTE